MSPVFNMTIMKGGKINASVFLHFILYISDRFSFVIMSVSFLQKSEAKLDEILKEIRSLRDQVSSQEKRIIKLEEQISKIAI